jgi:hypothetical protein
LVIFGFIVACAVISKSNRLMLSAIRVSRSFVFRGGPSCCRTIAPRLPQYPAFTLAVRTKQQMSTITSVSTPNAPSAIGPYSQAIKAGEFVFVSGCIPLVPSTMQIVEGGIEEQTKQALTNLKAVLEASSSSVGKVVKTTVCCFFTETVVSELNLTDAWIIL